MLSDEEKKALKDCDIIFMCLEDMMSEESANDARKSYKIIRNLIQTQQKGISLLKDQLEYVKSEYEETIEQQQKEIEELKENYIRLQNTEAIQDIYIKKDKIKAKIEEVEQWELYNMKIPKLSTLDERLGAKIGIKYVLQSLL